MNDLTSTSMADSQNYEFLKLTSEKLVLVEKCEKENVTVKILVTSSLITSDSLTPSAMSRYRSLSNTPDHYFHSSLLSSPNEINYKSFSNEIILKLNISSKFCSISSTEDEWKATRAVIVSLSVILILLLTLLSLTLICVWRKEKRRKLHKSIGSPSSNNTNELSWKERTDRKISWKEESREVGENGDRKGRGKYFASFNLFPAKKKNSSQEIQEENYCDTSQQVRFVHFVLL